MRSIVKVFRVLVYWAWEVVTFMSCFFGVDAAFRGVWALCGSFMIVWMLMRFELDKIKEWAEKF